MTRVGARLVAAALALSTAGWDTEGFFADTEPQWLSIYRGVHDLEAPRLWVDGEAHTEELTGNEHLELSHIAMLQLGWGALYTTPMPQVLDLNASVWRPEVRTAVGAGTTEDGDRPETPLVERNLPHPARWSGLADFSYTVYDWINRNVLCPAVPEDDPSVEHCHTPKVWLGAALNSSHFGDQATAMYEHLHGLALALGRNAGAMRARLEANASDADAAPVEAMIREAELEALAFEGYAQHFLQDRWASGHMWNRWGGPDYQGAASLSTSVVVGLFSGLIHGAEALFRGLFEDEWVPDQMCSPSILEGTFSDTLLPTRYVGGGRESTPGVGDYRLEDALDRGFGAEHGYDDLELDVSSQLADMFLCSRAGWADVARGFGVGLDGSVGVLGLPDLSEAPTFSADGITAFGDGRAVKCWEHWATNNSMSMGVNDATKNSLWLLLSGAAAGTFLLENQALTELTGLDLPEIGKVFFAIQAHALTDPFGTDLADGSALPSVMGILPGDAQLAMVPPSFTEPIGEDFSALAAHDDVRGRDWHALHGFFNGAHAGPLCEQGSALFEHDPALGLEDSAQGLRWPVPLPQGMGNQPTPAEASALQRRQEACVLLAERLHDRTSAWYRNAEYLGPQRELRKLGDGGAGAPRVAPACETLDALPVEWPDGPYQLHPGYVADGAPYTTTTDGERTWYTSLESWCAQVPVVHVDDEDLAVDAGGAAIAVTPGFAADGMLSFAPSVRDPEVTIHGLHFGAQPGDVELDGERGCAFAAQVSNNADIVAWSDTAITIRVPHTRFVPDLYQITVLRADRNVGGGRVRSLGRARLDVRKAAFGEVADISGPLPTTVSAQWFAAIHPFCAGGSVLNHRIHDCTGVADQTCGADGGTGPLLWADGVPATRQSGPYAEHEWYVAQTAACPGGLPGWVVCLPQYAQSYGMAYRFERTAFNSVTASPKRWRFTLVWQR